VKCIHLAGAFLIPYALMILLIGIPLLFMEYGFGQYFGIGSLSIFKQVCPLFQGMLCEHGIMLQFSVLSFKCSHVDV